jgi:hypothetical protein
MDNKQVQVNIRIAENSAVRLKELADSARLKLGAFVERLIAAYSADSNLLQNDSSAGSWESGIEALRALIAQQDVRLNALEVAVMSGLGGREGKVRVIVKAADLESVEAKNDSPSHPADSSFLPPQSPDDFEELVKRTYKECGYSVRKTLEALRENGQGIGQARLYRILGKKE